MGFLFVNLILAFIVGGGIWIATRPTRRPRTPVMRARRDRIRRSSIGSTVRWIKGRRYR